MKRRLRALLCALALLAASQATAQPRPQPPPAQEEFVPLSEIPPDEQIPAFTLVASAYALVWLALIGYVWSVAKRLHRVESDLATLARERK